MDSLMLLNTVWANEELNIHVSQRKEKAQERRPSFDLILVWFSSINNILFNLSYFLSFDSPTPHWLIKSGNLKKTCSRCMKEKHFKEGFHSVIICRSFFFRTVICPKDKWMDMREWISNKQRRNRANEVQEYNRNEPIISRIKETVWWWIVLEKIPVNRSSHHGCPWGGTRPDSSMFFFDTHWCSRQVTDDCIFTH